MLAAPPVALTLAVCLAGFGFVHTPETVFSGEVHSSRSTILRFQEVLPEAATNCNQEMWSVNQSVSTPGLHVTVLGKPEVPPVGGSVTCVLMFTFDTGAYTYDGAMRVEGDDVMVIGLKATGQATGVYRTIYTEVGVVDDATSPIELTVAMFGGEYKEAKAFASIIR